MRPTSARWTEGITSSHQLAVDVRLEGLSPLPVDGGSVTLDNTAATRGRADLSFTDFSLVPGDPSDTLAPYDNELTIKRGIVYPDGERELVQLGVMRVEEVEVSESGISVSLLDRSQRVIDARFEDAYEVVAGTQATTEIANLLGAVVPDLQTQFPSLDKPLPTVYAEELADRWAFVQDLAAALGMELYFDNLGVAVLRPIPDPADDPVAHLVEGREGVTVRPSLLDLSKRWSRTDAFNRWKVVGENPEEEGAAPSAVVTDDNPYSPTYYLGSFGKKPADIYTSSWITDDDQAQAAAEGLRRTQIGTTQSVSFGALVNPALEPGDVVHITRTRRDPGNLDSLIEIADERHVIDSLTFPLEASGTMTGTTRAVKVTG